MARGPHSVLASKSFHKDLHVVGETEGQEESALVVILVNVLTKICMLFREIEDKREP